MDQRQLSSFVTLAEELHFVRAAARLGVTQPALSQQIAKLEESLSVRLFERTKRRVALTDAGRVFLADALTILRQFEQAAMGARRAAKGQIGRLTIGFVEASPFNVLPRLVSRLSRELPEVSLVLQEMVTEEQVEALRSGRIDVGLLRPMFNEPGFGKLPLLRENYLVALPASHPLAEADSVPLSALREERFIVTPARKRRYVEGRFRAAFKRAGFEPQVAQEVNQLHTIIGLVGGGIGVALVPQSISRLDLEGVVYRPLQDDDSPVAELAAAWSLNRETPVLRRFLAIARAALVDSG
ncbi:LysR substrate-binding domain-containing protein [Bosea sp. (in: a-proteobacteria)]|jgi:DNA-binding transcriptional LysR family regulator|uniref:LysR substrate-binding domain-containing protein n=1 Tax=Bosea sp. (in: a-proteobacteria) TaxID=1871050 RepID=UPI002DDDA91A|nr:LysR substrate-binding domain-containing protein [Bosea sp. (in: a-proteobacteria)]HEV2512641.1 LysR substrate-binding domain-containing protein [Bosea sp. (in: a-proteobacteria)]